MFKVGEKIRCKETNMTLIDPNKSDFTKDKIYVVKEMSDDGMRVRVEKDDFGRVNGWNAKKFESVKVLFYKELLED